ncbi:MAG: tetratricopeptide repeat protein [Pleurocapsa sp.]
MRHKSGQIEQNHNQSNSNSSNSDSVPPLTDANYEFLFNQLLEGVAHGWHSIRIVKFFQQLEDRGEQKDWVAWLERFNSKISNTSSISIQRMATLMVRLGELTQSTPQIRQIGLTSYQIGRKILFGDTSNLIWEYDGADIQPHAQSTTANSNAEEKAENLSELNLSLNNHTDQKLSLNQELDTSTTPVVQQELESSQLPANNIIPELDLDDIADQKLQQELESSQLPANNTIPELDLDDISSNDLEILVDNIELEQSESITDNSKPELNTGDAVKDSPKFKQQPTENQNSNSPIADNSQLKDPDWQELMKMIQEHDRLVQQISKKLNISSAEPELSNNAHQQLEQSDRTVADNSVMELVESWFNLGLKQVSTGDFNGAIASWEKALNLNPNLSEAWHNRGSALGRLNKYEAAIESFERSLVVAPNNYQAWNDRAHALYQLQKWTEATESWEKAIEIMPGNHLFWYNRGCALEQLNRLNESIASYEKALEIKPDFQPARLRYINLVADNSPPN